MTEGRVLVLGQLPPPVHGSTMMNVHLLDALHASGIPTVLVQRRFSGSVDEVGRPTVRKALQAPALLMRLAVAVLTTRPAAAIVFLTNRPMSFVVDAVLVAALRILRVPTVHYVHTVGFTALGERGPVWRAAVSRTLRSAVRVVVLGERLGGDVAVFVSAERLRIVGNTAGRIPALHPRPAAGGPVAVLFLSNLLPEKGVDHFVDIASELVARSPDIGWRFTIAGAGGSARQSAVAARIATSPAADRFAVHGPADEASKWRLLAEASVLVFPSTYPAEAQPLTIVEALAAGTPVVASDIGGIADLVDGEVGALVPPGDIDAAARAVLGLQRRGALDGGVTGTVRARYDTRHAAPVYGAAWHDILIDVMQRTAGRNGSGRRADDAAGLLR